MDYTENDFVRIAKRENNNKRGFLIVNPLQGKHIPVPPGKALSAFESLSHLIDGKYAGENILFIGFAETATAIGAEVASVHKMNYIQTTREKIPNIESIFFSEEHSHATEQKLVKDDFVHIMASTDRIVFVEDELTTGKTILNLAGALNRVSGREMKYSVMSLLNGMSNENLDNFKSLGIDVFYLVKTKNSEYEKIAASIIPGGNHCIGSANPAECEILEIGGYMDARRLVDAAAYKKACLSFAEKACGKIEFAPGAEILVMGTEEFMYPSLCLGKALEERGMRVMCHSTTRSPISVCAEKSYPLHSRFQIPSLYDKNRKTFIYDLKKYDHILIATDSPLSDMDGVWAILNVVREFNFCKSISVVRWA